MHEKCNALTQFRVDFDHKFTHYHDSLTTIDFESTLFFVNKQMENTVQMKNSNQCDKLKCYYCCEIVNANTSWTLHRRIEWNRKKRGVCVCTDSRYAHTVKLYGIGTSTLLETSPSLLEITSIIHKRQLSLKFDWRALCAVHLDSHFNQCVRP